MPRGDVFAVGGAVEGGAFVTLEHTHADGGEVYGSLLFVLEEESGVSGKGFAMLGQTAFKEIIVE